MMRNIFRLAYRAFVSSLDKPTLFFILIFPAFLIFVMGYAYSGIIPSFMLGGETISYPVFLASGAVTLVVVNSGMTVGTIIWFDRKFGMYEQILVGPFRRYEYMAGIILATILVSLLSAGLALTIASPVLAGTPVTLPGLLYAGLTLAVGSVLFGSLALIISIHLRSSESFNVVSNFIFFTILFTSSVFYPAEYAPQPIKLVAELNPLTYLADAFRAGLLGIADSNILFKTGILMAEGFALLAVASLMFSDIKA